MFQSGFSAIGSGTNIVEITFPTAFDVLPAVQLAVIRNVSADGSKYFIGAEVTDCSTTSMEVALDTAPDTANYELVWLAGSTASILDAMSALAARKLSGYATANSLPKNFQIPFLNTDQSSLSLLTAAAFWGSLVSRAAAVPGAPNTGLVAGRMDMAVDANWLYIQGPSGWGRVPVEFSTSWETQPFYRPFREAVARITPVADTYVYTITYATAFAEGVVPKVMITLHDLNGVDVEVLGCQVVFSDNEKFKIAFTSVPSSSTLDVYYMARHLPE